MNTHYFFITFITFIMLFVGPVLACEYCANEQLDERATQDEMLTWFATPSFDDLTAPNNNDEGIVTKREHKQQVEACLRRMAARDRKKTPRACRSPKSQVINQFYEDQEEKS